MGKMYLREVILFILFFSFIFPVKATVSFWNGHSYSTSWYDPNKSTYYIQSADDLAGLSHLLMPGSYINFTDKEVILMTDIDLNNHEWETIGRIDDSSYYTFKGTFNGNGKTISGLKISTLNNGFTKTTGLFGVLMESKAIVKNLILEGTIDLTCNSLYGASIGGITGLNYATIYNCISKVNIKVNSINSSGIYIGSLTGNNYNVIRNCLAKGNIHISQDAISKCRLGGIAGNSATENSSISSCNSETNITVVDGKDAVIGGISGWISGKNSNNLYSGNIDTNDCYTVYAGGIMSMGDIAENCLMLGSFSGYGKYYYKGAIIPTENSDVIISNCYYKKGVTNPTGHGICVEDDFLLSGKKLRGLDVPTWNYIEGSYPDLFFSFEDLIDKPSVERIELDANDLILKVNESRKLNPRFYPEGTSDNVTWNSSNENVAVVSSNGLIIARNEGETNIIATTSQGLSSSCHVTVTNSTTANETISTESTSIKSIKGGILINSYIQGKTYIYTLKGEIINSYDLSIGENRILIPNGIYIVKVSNFTQKVIVF